MTKLWTELVAVIPIAAMLTGCLGERAGSSPECRGGDSFRHASGWYCIFTGPIIIEGFLCPDALPHEVRLDGAAMGLGDGSGQVALCSASEAAPTGGWREVFDQWRAGGGQPRPWPGDTADATDTFETADTSPDTPGPVDTQPGEVGPEDTADTTETVEPPAPCGEGLSAGLCWVSEQCPSAWSCQGASPACTLCEACPGASAGECVASQDAVALVWDKDERFAVWSVASVYTLIPCPGFVVETATAREGPWESGPSEQGCADAVAPPYASPLVRPMPVVDAGLWTRLRATLRTGCFTADPAQCSGSAELTSEALPPLP